MELKFQETPIKGFFVAPLKVYTDSRGQTAEIFRDDWVKCFPGQFYPAMNYMSITNKGIARGPHEHATQTDYFAFIGPGNFRFTVWRKIEGSPTPQKWSIVVGEGNPMALLVRPGVVHAYQNIGDGQGICLNMPNVLFKGFNKLEPVDETRWENVTNSPYIL